MSSYKFKYKTFEKIQLNDVISCPQDLKFYRIFAKYSKLDRYKDTNQTFTFPNLFLQGSEIQEHEIYTREKTLQKGPLVAESWPSIKTFEMDKLIGRSYLVQDIGDKYFHKHDFVQGNIILDTDKCHYRIEDYVQKYSFDYGIAYDFSYYNMIRVNIDGKVVEPIVVEKLEIGPGTIGNVGSSSDIVIVEK